MDHSPYKFLDYYDFADKDFYFGREEEINILVADVVVNRLVVLFARTGTGKTSLINAGVRPRLEERGYSTFYIRVEKDPTEAARDALKLVDAEGTVSLSEQLCSLVDSFGKPIVLFFDQFEEFFLHIQDGPTRQKFIEDISELYQDAESGVHLVFSMREEYYYRMDEFREDIPSIFHKNSNLRLMPLDEDQARAAIIQPAAALRVELDLSLANEIIKDLQKDKEGIRAPSLQIICDTLWRKEDPADRHITLKDYEELGRGQSILDKRLAEDLEHALEEAPELLAIMQRLIPELKTDRDTKYPRLISDLVNRLETTKETLQDLITRLKGVAIVKEITISGDEAIEWASDYLAERTLLLEEIVRSLELQRTLQIALEGKAIPEGSDLEYAELADDILPPEWRLSLDDFLEISNNSTSIKNLQTREIEFLFDTALYYQRNMRDWFYRVPVLNTTPAELLRQKMYDKDMPINLRRGVIELLGQLGLEQALPLLKEALDESDLADESINVLLKFKDRSVFQLLASSLEQEDHWEFVISTLARSRSERAVLLLQPLLQQETKFFSALTALEQLAKSGEPAGSIAVKSLELAVPLLEQKLDHKSTADSSGRALVRLSKFREPLGSKAKEVLNRSDNAASKKPEISSKTLGEKIKDLPVQSRSGSALLRRRSNIVYPPPNDYLDDIMPFLRKGTVVPVIGNSFRVEQIFRSEQELANQLSGNAVDEKDDDELDIMEQITREWASEIQYPMMDDHNLARVAQFYQVEQRESILAKTKYLRFLANFLLFIAEEEEEYRDIVRELRAQDSGFSDIVAQLDYPRFPSGFEDPLRLLAKLPLKIYVTTSYFNFLERALEAENKKPRSQVCFWSGGKSSARFEHTPDPLFEPTESQPAVYHLYGLEDYPQTLVLSEDDHLNFLISVVEDYNTQNPIVPLRLREALAESRLLFMGYRIRDWDFRILFKFISRYRSFSSAPRGMLLQQKPTMQERADASRTLEYISQYFDQTQFDVDWTNPEKFVRGLYDKWHHYIQGQL